MKRPEIPEIMPEYIKHQIVCLSGMQNVSNDVFKMAVTQSVELAFIKGWHMAMNSMGDNNG